MIIYNYFAGQIGRGNPMWNEIFDIPEFPGKKYGKKSTFFLCIRENVGSSAVQRMDLHIIIVPRDNEYTIHITNRWRHQTVVKKREFKVGNCSEKAVQNIPLPKTY